jgi:hypothetical protein
MIWEALRQIKLRSWNALQRRRISGWFGYRSLVGSGNRPLAGSLGQPVDRAG